MLAVITGASKGIGFAIAEAFAKQGYNLLLTAKTDIDLYNAIASLQTKYSSIEVTGKCFNLATDAKAFAAYVLSKTNQVDVLINNAGFFAPGNISDEPDGNLEMQIATNLYSAYYTTRGILPIMLAAKSGHIFNICSIAGLQAYNAGGSYSISKFAMDGFSKNLRQELMPAGIKVTTVYPGAVLTKAWGDFDNSAKRIMEATDIAQMVVAASQLSVAACVEQIIIRPQQGDL
jgi:short-subunit dehydrogenase